MKRYIVKYWKVKFEDANGKESTFIPDDFAIMRSGRYTLFEFRALYPDVNKYLLVCVKLTKNRMIEYSPASF